MCTDNRFFRKFATLTASFALLFCFSAHAAEGTFEWHDEPKPAPKAVYYDESGAEHAIASPDGKPIIVHFWATWCPPCIEEMSGLQIADDNLVGMATVLPISLDRDMEKVREFYATYAITLPMAMDKKQAAMRTFGIRGLPASVILNAKGEEIARHEGVVNWYDDELFTKLDTGEALPLE